ncbi:hypothetical protein ACIRQQ_49010, partial [Streptomyces fuscichromogenes]|uniref:hypothetical protein n=1 Tax=Streptomyces fuscichromogenes TaxID=1324013 RepID=UPI003809CA49
QPHRLRNSTPRSTNYPDPSGISRVQDSGSSPPIFDADGDGLDSGLTPVLVWHIDPSDLMADFRAVIVDDLDELNRSPMTVCASTEVPLLATLKDANVATAASAVNDDFDDLVDRRHPREAGGTGDTPTQA